MIIIIIINNLCYLNTFFTSPFSEEFWGVAMILINILALIQFYAKASEAESWMKDKKPLVLQEEYGKDEDGTQVSISSLKHA